MRAEKFGVVWLALAALIAVAPFISNADPVITCMPWQQTKCGCHQKEDPQTGQCKQDANTYGCPCLDVTNGYPTPGTCISPKTDPPNPHCLGSGQQTKPEDKKGEGGKPPEMPKPPESKDSPPPPSGSGSGQEATSTFGENGFPSSGSGASSSGIFGDGGSGFGDGGSGFRFGGGESSSLEQQDLTTCMLQHSAQECVQFILGSTTSISSIGSADILALLRGIAGSPFENGGLWTNIAGLLGTSTAAALQNGGVQLGLPLWLSGTHNLEQLRGVSEAAQQMNEGGINVSAEGDNGQISQNENENQNDIESVGQSGGPAVYIDDSGHLIVRGVDRGTSTPELIAVVREEMQREFEQHQSQSGLYPFTSTFGEPNSTEQQENPGAIESIRNAIAAIVQAIGSLVSGSH